MSSRIKSALVSRPVFLGLGSAVLLIVAFLVWVSISTALSFRVPIPSPDGAYFAYFNPVQLASQKSEGACELIVANSRGQLLARFGTERGYIAWSSAKHLAVTNEARTDVTIIVNSLGRFFWVTRLALSPETDPRWSWDGTKLAFIRPGASGDDIVVYDLQQPAAYRVPLSNETHLRKPTIISWAPGSQELYFLNTEGVVSVLEKVELRTGNAQVLARVPGWGDPGINLPRLSPDGTRIYLPLPLHSVIDSRTGETSWKAAPEAAVLWSGWSADGSRLYYARQVGTTEVYAHDFGSHTDQLLLKRAPSNGFLSLDGRSYFYRARLPGRPYLLLSSLRDWLKPPWVWQQVDMGSQSTQALGRLHLFPWVQTEEGLILAGRADWGGPEFGLYDPNGRATSVFPLPTAQDDLGRQIHFRIPVLVSILLYAVLALVVYLMRPGSVPVRALYLLSLTMILCLASAEVTHPALLIQPAFPYSLAPADVTSLGWFPASPYYPLTLGLAFLFVASLALIPPAVHHFVAVFPGQTWLMRRRRAARFFLQGFTFLPLAAILLPPTLTRVAGSHQSAVVVGLLIAGLVALAPGIFALIYTYSRPSSRRVWEQVRWIGVSFGLPMAAMGAFIVAELLAMAWSQLVGKTQIGWLESLKSGTPLVWLFTPVAIGYAVLAHRLYDAGLFVRRAFHYFLLGFVALMIYVPVVQGLSRVVEGPQQHPSTTVMLTAFFLTALTIAPIFPRLRTFLDRTFDRPSYQRRLELERLPRELSTLRDRRALAARLTMTLPKALGARGCSLFILDRRARKLRPQPGFGTTRSGAEQAGFDPSEPLCRYLQEEGAFQVGLLPEDSTLNLSSAVSDGRLEHFEATLVLGLERRGELLGVLLLGDKETGEFYNSEDLKLLGKVADAAANILDRTDVLVEPAREGQSWEEKGGLVAPSLWPPLRQEIRMGGCEIAARCLSGRSAGGEYYDSVAISGDRIGVAIGDVSGRGAPARELAARVRGWLRTQAPQGESPADLVRTINRQLYTSSRGAKHCAIFYGVYDPALRQFEFVNAGHHPPIVLGDGAARFLESTGIPLGLSPEVTHETRSLVLEPGAIIVFYSDGITETRNKAGDAYGVDRLISFVSHGRALEVAKLLDQILNDVRGFAAEVPFDEDQTLVLLRTSSVG